MYSLVKQTTGLVNALQARRAEQQAYIASQEMIASHSSAESSTGLDPVHVPQMLVKPNATAATVPPGSQSVAQPPLPADSKSDETASGEQ